ncbi:unnamed protein product, partial [Polarella glacialis]
MQMQCYLKVLLEPDASAKSELGNCQNEEAVNAGMDIHPLPLPPVNEQLLAGLGGGQDAAGGNLDCEAIADEEAAATFPRLEFFFGTALPTSANSTAILDSGTGFGVQSAQGMAFGWNCDGDSNVDYSGGRRGPGRAGGLGLNHFDRWSSCQSSDGSGSAPPVNWELAVPNGTYEVTVYFSFGRYITGSSTCEVEGVNANCEASECVVQRSVAITDGRFTVTGHAFNTRGCHSLNKVVIQSASSTAPAPAPAPLPAPAPAPAPAP